MSKKSFSALILSTILLFTLWSCQPEQNQYVDVHQGKLFFKTLGKGTPIIAIHGGPGLSHTYLTPQLNQLSQFAKVTYYDQRGSGQSLDTPLTSETINIEQFVNDLKALQDRLSEEKIVLLGHSWGGFVAMNYALQYPEKVKGLILVNSAPGSIEEYAGFVENFTTRTADLEQEIKALNDFDTFKSLNAQEIQNLYRAVFTTYMHDPKHIDSLTLDLQPKEAQSGFKVSELMMSSTLFSEGFDLHPQLQGLNIPTLVIHGTDDVIPLSCAEKINNSIPNAQLITVAKSGHFAYIEESNTFFTEVEEFVNNLS